jgi:hypothetical protein
VRETTPKDHRAAEAAIAEAAIAEALARLLLAKGERAAVSPPATPEPAGKKKLRRTDA